MSWLFFALLSTILDTTVVFIDKYIVSKQVKDYAAMPIYAAIVGVVAGTLYWIYTGFPIASTQTTLIILLAGIFQLFAAVTYFKALSKDDASDLTILFQVTPIFILVLSYFFLNETISFNQSIGFIIILIASILTSVHKSVKKIRISAAFFLILISDFMWALSSVLAKFTIDATSFKTILSYESFGIGIGGILLYMFVPSIRHSFHTSLKKIRMFGLTVIFLNEFVFVIAKAVRFFAFTLGSVVLIGIIMQGAQSFVAMLFGYVLTKIAPRAIKEDISNKNMGKKIIAAVLLVIGIVLLS